MHQLPFDFVWSWVFYFALGAPLPKLLSNFFAVGMTFNMVPW